MTLILPFSIGFPIQIICHELLLPSMSKINNMSEHSTSLKDQGNEEFKKGNYPSAIEFYSQYVQTDNPDNQKAYTNLAMSHFKLGNYYPCIEACQKALLKDSTFAKAYYRLYLTYKELPNEEYNTFVNAHLFLKNFKEDNPASRIEALKVYNEFKGKFKCKKSSLLTFNTAVLEEIVKDGSEIIQNEEYIGSVIGWQQFFTSKKIKRQQKLTRIHKEMEIDLQDGANIGYMYLNCIEKREQKKAVAERIHQMRDAINERKRKSNAKQQQMIEEISENLFQPEIQEESSQQHALNNQYVHTYPKKGEEKAIYPSEIPQNMKSHQNSQILKQPLPTAIQKSQQLPLASQNSSIFDKIQKITSEKPLIKIDATFLARIPARLSSSRDIFSTLEEIIMQVLQSTAALEEKKSLLSIIPNSIREISMIKSSFSAATQIKIHAKLKQIGLESLSQVYAPKCQ